MKKLSLCLLFILAISRISAQIINLDSLVKVAMLVSIKDQAATPHNPDSILRTLFVSKSPAERIRKVYDIILLDNGELDRVKAFYYHRKILDLARKNKDAVVEAVITGELGFTLYEDGDSPAGLKMLFDALKLAEKTGNNQAIGTVYNNLGICDENIDTSIADYKKAFQYSLAGGDKLFASADLKNLSVCYIIKRDTDMARYYFSKAFEIAISSQSRKLITECMAGVGQFQTDTKLKLKYLRYALALLKSSHDTYSNGNVLLSMAGVYRDEHKTDSALIYAKNAYSLLNGKIVPIVALCSVIGSTIYGYKCG